MHGCHLAGAGGMRGASKRGLGNDGDGGSGGGNDGVERGAFGGRVCRHDHGEFGGVVGVGRWIADP